MALSERKVSLALLLLIATVIVLAVIQFVWFFL